MAVLKQDLLRSTFQERQINLLTSISKNTESTSISDNNIYNFLRADMLGAFDDMFSKLSDSLERALKTGTAAYVKGLSQIASSQAAATSQQTRAASAAQVQQENQKQFSQDVTRSLTRIVSGLSDLSHIYGISLERFTSDAESYSELTNILVKNTGTTRMESKELRDSILKSVEGLNSKYDNLFNSLDSYNTIVGLVNTTGNKNTGFYEEYGGSLLKAEKTMNVDLATLAEFADKFYRAYKFSSSTMESLMSSVRANTANTSVSEDEQLRFIDSMRTELLAASSRMGGNPETNFNTLQSQISSVYSWLDTEGYNPETIFKSLLEAVNDPASQAGRSVYMAGIDPNTISSRLATDPVSLVTEYLNSMGSHNLFGKGTNATASNRFLEVYGFDPETVLINELQGGLSSSSYKDFLSRSGTATDPGSELYLSANDRVSNSLSSAGSTLSDIQESLGTNLSVLTRIGRTLENALGGTASSFASSTVGNFLGKVFIDKITSAGGFGKFLGAGGSILGSIAGVALIVDYFYSEYTRSKWQEDQDKDVATNFGKAVSTGSYLGVSDTGRTYVTSDRPPEGNSQKLESTGVSNVATNKSPISQASDWVATNILGYSQEGLNLGMASKATSDKYAAILANMAADYYSKGDFTLANMLAAYDKKGILQEPWEYQYLAGGGSDKAFLPKALKAFKDRKILLDPYKNLFGTEMYSEVPAYRLGTNYVQSDSLALVHEGESIIPASMNPFTKYSKSGSSDYLYQIASHTGTTSSITVETLSSLRSLQETMRDLYDFLKFWKTDRDTREDLARLTENSKTISSKLASVLNL